MERMEIDVLDKINNKRSRGRKLGFCGLFLGVITLFLGSVLVLLLLNLNAYEGNETQWKKNLVEQEAKNQAENLYVPHGTLQSQEYYENKVDGKNIEVKFDIKSEGEYIETVGFQDGSEAYVFSIVDDFFLIDYDPEYEDSIAIQVSDDLQGYDNFYVIDTYATTLYGIRYISIGITMIGFLITLISLVQLLRNAGTLGEDGQIAVKGSARIPIDAYTLVIGLIGVIPLVIGGAVANGIWTNYLYVIGCIALWSLLLAMETILVVLYIMNIIIRVKSGNLIKNSLIWMISSKIMKRMKRFGSRLIESSEFIPSAFRTYLIFGIICILLIIGTLIEGDGGLRFLLLLLVIVPCFLTLVLTINTLGQLKKGCKSLAEGNLDYQINTDLMIWEFKEAGDEINAISKGMTTAVEEQLKSERMKTELITNVSHDIKTPLTSIINYADLIGKEETNNEKIKEYAEILLRQSDRLKRLITDLVEASKVTSGNVEIQLMPCTVDVLVAQVAGEFTEKLKLKDITLVVNKSNNLGNMIADSRHIWRVFDNLFNNIYKYAQEHTRVYLNVGKVENTVVFSLKNISKNELNISSEELLERFVRGDSSRNSEGNGLGLSIAKSLVEIQGGRMSLEIDGDLFKVELKFPLEGYENVLVPNVDKNASIAVKAEKTEMNDMNIVRDTINMWKWLKKFLKIQYKE